MKTTIVLAMALLTGIVLAADALPGGALVGMAAANDVCVGDVGVCVPAPCIECIVVCVPHSNVCTFRSPGVDGGFLS